VLPGVRTSYRTGMGKVPVMSASGRELSPLVAPMGRHSPLKNTAFLPDVSGTSGLLSRLPSSDLLTEPLPTRSRYPSTRRVAETPYKSASPREAPLLRQGWGVQSTAVEAASAVNQLTLERDRTPSSCSSDMPRQVVSSKPDGFLAQNKWLVVDEGW